MKAFTNISAMAGVHTKSINMRIVLYFINFNDSFYIPFIAKHYGAFCERIIMYDNYSTDNSRDIAANLRMEVRVFGRAGVLDDQHYLDVKNHCWKEQRGKGIDYVIVCDADEFVKIKSEKLLSACPAVVGFNMISDALPYKDIFEINTGNVSTSYSKEVVFSPDRLEEINFVHGCHLNNKKLFPTSKPYGQEQEERFLRDDIRLFHFRQIGGVQRLLNRHAIYRPRMSPFNLKNKMGFHYLHEDEQKKQEWISLQNNAIELW